LADDGEGGRDRGEAPAPRRRRQWSKGRRRAAMRAWSVPSQGRGVDAFCLSRSDPALAATISQARLRSKARLRCAWMMECMARRPKEPSHGTVKLQRLRHAHIRDSHKVYYGIFIYLIRSNTYLKLLAFPSAWAFPLGASWRP
jgi:hypothetical protein